MFSFFLSILVNIWMIHTKKNSIINDSCNLEALKANPENSQNCEISDEIVPTSTHQVF